MSGMSKRIVLGLSAAAITVGAGGRRIRDGPGRRRTGSRAWTWRSRPVRRTRRTWRPIRTRRPRRTGRTDGRSRTDDARAAGSDERPAGSGEADSRLASRRAASARRTRDGGARRARISRDRSGAFDETLIRTRAADVAAVEADETVARARIYAEVFQILTAGSAGEAEDDAGGTCSSGGAERSAGSRGTEVGRVASH